VNKVRATAGLGAATAMAVLGWAAVRPDDPTNTSKPDALISKPVPAPVAAMAVGASGCNGIACHGGPVAGLVPPSPWGTGPADLERWRSSATVWKAYDPHAHAFDVLGNELSRDIESRLAKPGEKPLDARADVRCLACHANPTLATQPDHKLLADGVSCESCHGNAGDWIKDHAGWPAGPGHSAKYGSMTYLSDPKVRAETCAGCHVGAPASGAAPVRDMNHDLIAAGHPRLNFDYATFLRALPPHWAEKDRDVSPPALRSARDEFRHWIVGRAATTAASYRLLADRAKRGPWPELAEFDCYACHHGLGGRDRALGHRAGALVWNEPPLAAALSGLDWADDMRAAIRRPADPEAIQQHAGQSAEGWQTLAAMWRGGQYTPERVAKQLADFKPSRWDEACHLYYALVALDRAAGRPPDPKLAEIRDALRLPRESDGARFNSPKDFGAVRLPFAELFRARSR
jgi:hypothetical protein